MSIVPPLLKKGDKIGIVATARVINELQLKEAYRVFQQWEWQTTSGRSLFSSHGYFAGNDEQRLTDIQEMLDSSDIKAIFCARGGYGTTRIIDKIDFGKFLKYPKWLIGFSDVTALHLKINQLGICSIHGLMPVQFDYMGTELSKDSLKTLLTEGTNKYKVVSHPLNKKGSTKGNIVGGNLSLICDSLGTGTEIDTKGKILFLEEIDEYLYKVDRMITQLKRAGKLDHLKAIIFGNFSQMKDTQIPFGKDIYHLLEDQFAQYNYPVVYDFPAGHEPYHLAIPLMAMAELSVKNKNVRLRF